MQLNKNNHIKKQAEDHIDIFPKMTDTRQIGP